MDELTVSEQRQLQHHEQQILQGLGNAYNALKIIHDKRLYRGTHESFESYCVERWKMGRSRAYQLLKHGQIRKLIEDNPETSTIVDTVKESHTREVADLPPEEGAAIIVETVKETGGNPTASSVRKTRSNSKPPTNGKPKKQRTQDEEFQIARSKCIKTCESLQRAFDDLNALRKMPEWHETVQAECDSLLIKAREWK